MAKDGPGALIFSVLSGPKRWPDEKIYALLCKLPAESLRGLYDRCRIQDCTCGAKELPCDCVEQRLFNMLGRKKCSKWHLLRDIADDLLADRRVIVAHLREWRRQFELLKVESKRIDGKLAFRVKKSRGRFYCGCQPRFEPCKPWCPFLREPDLEVPFWVHAFLLQKISTDLPGFHGQRRAFRDGYRDLPRPPRFSEALDSRAKAGVMARRAEHNFGLWHPLDLLQAGAREIDEGRLVRPVSNLRNGASVPGRLRAA